MNWKKQKRTVSYTVVTLDSLGWYTITNFICMVIKIDNIVFLQKKSLKSPNWIPACIFNAFRVFLCFTKHTMRDIWQRMAERERDHYPTRWILFFWYPSKFNNSVAKKSLSMPTWLPVGIKRGRHRKVEL